MTTQITGLSYLDVRRSPQFDAVADELDAFINEDVIIAHNAAFDMGTLYHAYEDTIRWYPPFIRSHVCSLEMSRKTRTDLRLHNLSALAYHYNIDSGGHRALADARATALIFEKLRLDSHPDKLEVTGRNNRNGVRTSKKRAYTSPIVSTSSFSGELAGKNVLCTGELQTYEREELHQLVQQLGGTVKKVISGKVNCLILGVNPGYKKLEFITQCHREGRDLLVISEREFYELVARSNSNQTSLF